LRDLRRGVDGLARRESAARELAAERFALEELLDDVGSALMLPDVVDRGDVGMVEDAGGFRLLLEATQAIRVLRERGRQDLDRDVAPEARILRAVDLSHAPGADLAEDLVGAEFRARRDGHLVGGSGSVICQMSALSLLRTT